MVGSDLIEVIEVALSEVLHLVDPVVLLAAVLSGNGDPALASLVVIAKFGAESISVLCFRFSCFLSCSLPRPRVEFISEDTVSAERIKLVANVNIEANININENRKRELKENREKSVRITVQMLNPFKARIKTIFPTQRPLAGAAADIFPDNGKHRF